MIDAATLGEDLQVCLDSMKSMNLIDLLSTHGILQKLARECLIMSLREQVTFHGSDELKAIEALFADTPIPPPPSLQGDWILQIPTNFRASIQERWNLLRQQKWIESTYDPAVHSFFLDHRSSLEQFVYGLIRLNDQGLADELYLRLIDEESDFFSLAKQFSEGIEKYTMGIVGPVRRSDIHAKILEALDQLDPTETSPPLRIGSLVVLVHFIHRQDPILDYTTKVALYKEMFEKDIADTLAHHLPLIIPELIIDREKSLSNKSCLVDKSSHSTSLPNFLSKS
jgi:hypothetical protein